MSPLGTKLTYGSVVSSAVVALWAALTWDGTPTARPQPVQWIEVVEAIKEREFAVSASDYHYNYNFIGSSITTQKLVAYVADTNAPQYAIPNGTNAPTMTNYWVVGGTNNLVLTNLVGSPSVDMLNRTKGRQIGLRTAGIFDTIRADSVRLNLHQTFYLAYDSTSLSAYMPIGSEMESYDGYTFIWLAAQGQYQYGYWAGSPTVSNAPGLFQKDWGSYVADLATNVNVEWMGVNWTLDHTLEGAWVGFRGHYNHSRGEGVSFMPISGSGLRTNHIISVPAYEWELDQHDPSYQTLLSWGLPPVANLHTYFEPNLLSLGALETAASAIRTLIPKYVSSVDGGTNVHYLTVTNLFQSLGVGNGAGCFTGETNVPVYFEDYFGNLNTNIWHFNYWFLSPRKHEVLEEMYKVLAACAKTPVPMQIVSNEIMNVSSRTPDNAIYHIDGHSVSVDNSLFGTWTNGGSGKPSIALTAWCSPFVHWYVWNNQGTIVTQLYMGGTLDYGGGFGASRTDRRAKNKIRLPDFPSDVAASVSFPAVNAKLVSTVISRDYEGNSLVTNKTITTNTIAFSAEHSVDASFSGTFTGVVAILSPTVPDDSFAGLDPLGTSITMHPPATPPTPAWSWIWDAISISQTATNVAATLWATVNWTFTRCKP